ncbi:tripartite tricarboxylate transporter substrate binding protein [Ramlibacter sp. PS3R-8]|uniref:tripartite tricarboxylate transporter substrate binding protein n=1 Tax=Ramlibacter sp. PS3R-8 TaxID=3133437 RepID=UPI003094B96E
MKTFSRLFFAGLAVCAMAAAHAQAWPTRPVKLVVPFAPGGAVDATARLLAQELQAELGQTVVVENRTGAGGVIAVDQVAKSAPDGYTLALAASTNLTMAFISGQAIPYGLNDLTYVAHVARSQLVFVARKDFPAGTLQQVLEQAAARPGKVTYGDLSLDGIGAVPLTYGYLSRLQNVEFLRVPYRGEAPILTALLGGEIDLSMVTYTAALPHLQAGTIKAIAAGSRARFATLPQLPTIAETTIPGYEAGSSFIIVGPAKLPPEVVTRMNTAVNQVLARPSVQKQMADLGLVRTGGPVEVARNTIAAESKTWQCVIAAVKGTGAANASCFQGSGQ